jgi:hypothetical protein
LRRRSAKRSPSGGDPSANAPGHLVNGAFRLAQTIGAGEALRSGGYAKTLTFTLWTTSV